MSSNKETFTIRFVEKSTFVPRQKVFSFKFEQMKISNLLVNYSLWSNNRNIFDPQKIKGSFVINGPSPVLPMTLDIKDMGKNLLDIVSLSNRRIYTLYFVEDTAENVNSQIINEKLLNSLKSYILPFQEVIQQALFMHKCAK